MPRLVVFTNTDELSARRAARLRKAFRELRDSRAQVRGALVPAHRAPSRSGGLRHIDMRARHQREHRPDERTSGGERHEVRGAPRVRAGIQGEGLPQGRGRRRGRARHLHRQDGQQD